MADLEDAENEMVEQERWGLNRVGGAAVRLAAAVRVLRGRVATQDARLDRIEQRLDAAGIPKAPQQ